MKINKLAVTMLGATVLSAVTASATTVKIMYAYTPTVKNSFGGTSQTKTKLRVKERLNQDVFDDSTTKVTFNRVSLFETDYDTTDDAVRQLERMVDSTSRMIEVLEKREDENADLVQLYAVLEADGKGDLSLGVARSGGWGSVVDGYLMNVNSNPLKYVAAHEMAHNFTATHSEAITLSDGRYTVVYAGDDSVERVPVFSSSSKTYDGLSLGDSNNNNRGLIRGYRGTVKNFK